jgi:hypothetical protein
MSAILSPPWAMLSISRPTKCSIAIDDHLAKADGLTLDEAQKLALWLEEAGFGPIEVVYEADQCSVMWKK